MKGIIKTLEISQAEVDALYADGFLPCDPDAGWFPNQYVVFWCEPNRIPCKVSKDRTKFLPVKRKLEAKTVKPKKGNDEQLCALDALLDDSIPVVVITGLAGSGKTFLALGAALQKIEDGKYDKVVLSKPMTQIGEEFGILPGEIGDKYLPYLGNYTSNLEQIFGQEIRNPAAIGMDIQPLQFIRGISWAHKVVIADEVQSLGHHEMLTLGTRVGQGTKLILMGDLDQIDRPIARGETGLYELISHHQFASSPLTAVVNLTKVERSPVTELFTQVFRKG